MMTPEERNYLAGWSSETQAILTDLYRDPADARLMARVAIRNARELRGSQFWPLRGSKPWLDGWVDAALAAFGLDA